MLRLEDGDQPAQVPESGPGASSEYASTPFRQRYEDTYGHHWLIGKPSHADGPDEREQHPNGSRLFRECRTTTTVLVAVGMGGRLGWSTERTLKALSDQRGSWCRPQLGGPRVRRPLILMEVERAPHDRHVGRAIGVWFGSKMHEALTFVEDRRPVVRREVLHE